MAEPTKQDIADLARVVALLADATAQHLDGSMSQRDAASNLHGLNQQASAIMRKFS